MAQRYDDLPILSPLRGRSLPPSIFNDVIGPVMRGPSSSHCAAAVRIGRLARDLMGGEITAVLLEFHPTGSLATTHETQGSDMGLFGGLLGWEATDPRLTESEAALREAGIRVEIRIAPYPAPHPNTYRMTLRGPRGEHEMMAVSTGGGMVEVVELDGVALSLKGDFHEFLIWVDGGAASTALAEEIAGVAKRGETVEEVLIHSAGAGLLVQVRGSGPPGPELQDLVARIPEVREARALLPVLPTLSRAGVEVPFRTPSELMAHAADGGLELWEAAILYESARGAVPPEAVTEEMDRIVEILESSVREGLAGTRYPRRILGPQAARFRDRAEAGQLLAGGILDTIIPCVTALMEVKSAMGVIVAAPTAGACGALPGACIGGGYALGVGREAMVKGMLAAGMIGVFIAERSTFAAEVCGCQAECGAGSGMAAAALVTLAGGTLPQALAASSMALQNTLGMICDPVANRVEVPCLGRNVLAAANALACANMALAGFDEVVPLEEVIDAMDAVGKSLPHELRCTALGGLSVTPTSKRILRELDEG